MPTTSIQVSISMLNARKKCPNGTREKYPFLFMHDIEREKPEKNHKSCLCKEQKPFHILQSFNSVYFMSRVKFKQNRMREKKVPKSRMDDLHNDGK